MSDDLSKFAFPAGGWHRGMTYREWLAGMAMQGLLACPPEGVTTSSEKIAAWSVEQADAVIAELSNPTSPPPTDAQA